MTSAILYRQLDKFIEDQAEETYNEWISEDLEEIQRQQMNFKREYDRLSLQLDQMIARLTRKLQTLKTVQRDAVNVEIKEANTLFANLQNSQNKLSNRLRYQRKKMQELCTDNQENLENYLPEPEVIAVYDKLINQNTLEVTLPVIGPIQITPQEMQKRIAGGNQSIFDAIEKRIQNFDYSDFEQRTERLVEECAQNVEVIAKREERLANQIMSYPSELAPLGADVIQHLTDLNLRQTPELQRFVKYLKEVLQLQVDIEVSAPETSQDSLFAELLQTCDQDGGKEKLIQLGMQIGYAPNDLLYKSEPELCQMLMQHFTL